MGKDDSEGEVTKSGLLCSNVAADNENEVEDDEENEEAELVRLRLVIVSVRKMPRSVQHTHIAASTSLYDLHKW